MKLIHDKYPVYLAAISIYLLACTCPYSTVLMRFLTPTPTATPSPTDTPLPSPTQTPRPFTLAFASDHEGNGEIYLFESKSGQLVNLTQNPAVDWHPAWSPDGVHIAFTSHRDGDSEIHIMEADGSNAIKVTNNSTDDYMPAWSPDGEHLVFVSERDGNQEIYTINQDGSGTTRLTINEKGLADRAPAWSPDGERIAFAGVRNGVEGIHVINIDGSEEIILTRWPLKGTSPAWSPDGAQIAFVGWDEEDRPGLYVMNTDGSDLTWLTESKAWIGSLTWSPEGGWLLLTSWRDENHELYAIRPDGLDLTRITSSLAWDDVPALSPAGGDFNPEVKLPLTLPPLSMTKPPPTRVQLGLNLSDLGKSYLVRDLGFTWVKSFIDWSGIEGQEKGQYDWIDPDNIVKACGSQGLKILMRVQWTPDWARPPETISSHPPNDPQDFADFMRAVASRYRGQVAAYEIWNEPNLNYEWGMRPPNPAEYVALLQAVYPAIKEADPDALVMAGGLSTTGGGGEGAMGDLDYIQGIYDAGGRGYFDALSSHPYGFGHDPDYEDQWGLFFSRVVAQHEVMAANNDGETPLWITEVGWVLESGWDLGEHQKWVVSEEQQAEYLVRACYKANDEWPWAGAIFLFNLDFSSVPWYESQQIMRWYSIINPDRSPRLAYTRLRMMVRGIGGQP